MAAQGEAAQIATLGIKIHALMGDFQKELAKTLTSFDNKINQGGTKTLKGLNKEAFTFKEEIQETGKAYDRLKVTAGGLGQEMGKSSKSIQALKTSAEGLKSAFSLIKGKTSLILGGFGFGALISGTKGLRNELLSLNESFASMSDATGSTSAAMSTYFSVMGKTGASAAQVMSSMKALEEQGLRPTQAGFSELTKLGADLSQATGVSADTFGSLNGKLMFNWKLPVEGIKQINSVMLKADFTGGQLTQVMNSVNENINKLSGYSKDGAKSAITLAAGITGVTKALVKMGINAQQATEFVSKLLDPEHLQDNMLLFAKMGISYTDFTKALTSAEGKETLFTKISQGLPDVARQLEQITDPLTRMNFAKTLGLSPEMVSKLVAAGPGQMQSVMKQAMEDAKNQDAIAKKQQKAKEAAAKLDERLHWMRMQLFSGLLPIFERNLPTFMKILNQVFQRGGQLFKWIGERFETIFKGTSGFFDAVLKGNWDAVPKTLGEGFKLITKDVMTQLSETVMPLLGSVWDNVLPSLISGYGTALKSIWSESKIAGLIATIYTGYKIFGPALQWAWELKKWGQQERLIRAVQGLHGAKGRGSVGGIGDFLFGRRAGLGTSARKGLLNGGAGTAMKGVGKGMLKAVPFLGMGLTALDLGLNVLSGDGSGTAGAIGNIVGGIVGALGGPAGIAIGSFIGGQIAEALYNKIEKKKIQEETGFFASKQQAQLANLSAGQYANIMGIKSSGDLATDKFRSAVAFEQLNKKYQETGSLQKTGNAMLGFASSQAQGGVPVTMSSKSEKQIFDDMVKMRSEVMTAEYKNAKEHLEKNKGLNEQQRANLQAIVDFREQYNKDSTLIEYQQLELKIKSGKELNEAEQKRYNLTKKMIEINSQEIAAGINKQGQEFKNLGRANFKNVTADMIKATESMLDTLGDTINGGIDVLKGGLLQAQGEIAKIGSSYVFGLFGDTKSRKFGETLAAGSNEWMQALLKQASEKKSTSAQVKFFKDHIAGLEKGGNDYLFKTENPIMQKLIKEGLGGEVKALEAKNKAEVDRFRETLIETLKKHVAIAEEKDKRDKKHVARTAGALGAIADHTKPKVERANVGTWVDFLRNSGIVEAGVVY